MTLEGKTASLEAEAEKIRDYFDAEYYLECNEDVREAGVDALLHFCEYGWRELRDPSSEFSISSYLDEHPEIREREVNPLVHFVSFREEEESQAVKPEVAESSLDIAIAERIAREADDVEPHFDAEFYLKTYGDIAEAGVDPLHHFMHYGWREGRDPSPYFSTIQYLRDHADISQSGVNPFWHYIVAGRQEGRITRPSGNVEEASDDTTGLDAVAEIRPYFDTEFYVSHNPDLAQAEIDPVAHYCAVGWKERRDPCPEFSTQFYLDLNPDIASLKINPFLHYVTTGRAEGRLARHPGGYQAERLRNTVPLEEEVKRWRSNRLPQRLLNTADLIDILSDVQYADRHTLILSVGHDNYRKVSGGVQLCEHREETLSAANGCLYLNLHPWQTLPRLAHETEESDPVMSLLLDGRSIGECHISDLIGTVGTVATEYNDVHVVIHHMLGHLPERLADLILATGRNECWLWLHDFFTLCPSYTLQRNGVSFCGAPPIVSNACRLCRFGEERRTHTDRMATFFKRVQVRLLSPSRGTAETWVARSGLRAASVEIRPHMKLEWRKRVVRLPREDHIVTIAFLGTPLPHKGWNVFENLFRALRHTERFRFLFLGAADIQTPGIEHERVHVTAEAPDAMIDAVVRNRVDLVLHWASWPETFSLSTYEAYAGGAYVITNEVSGNVAASVVSFGRGVVLRDVDDLETFFTDGRNDQIVRKLRTERRQSRVKHHLSRMVHDAIDAEPGDEQ
ncbi:hypothetical protein SAMN04487859_102253 [Roseovarius lutimaris]|uniref:Uncharacterized protein n=1 Tax=Roseovarius lutimaris TaxID=1005928 RepID=A0A1I4Z2U7_9RHOB|nr:hypothetical protein [Roseovarius lutimaris]SFN44591.1 hypothetical protein SAMN04487859_102253 [Roseovarius lutimaris]